MLLKIFTVYDVKAKAYMHPFLRNQVGEAMRDFSNSANDPKHMIGKNPEDYIAYEIGTFDDQTGTVQNHPEPKQHAKAIELLQD